MTTKHESETAHETRTNHDGKKESFRNAAISLAKLVKQIIEKNPNRPDSYYGYPVATLKGKADAVLAESNGD